MLVLSRKIGEIITIGSSIKITVLGFDRGIVRLGIEAPKAVPVHRKEVYDHIIEENRRAAKTELTALKKAISEVTIIPGNANTQAQSLPFVESPKSSQEKKS